MLFRLKYFLFLIFGSFSDSDSDEEDLSLSTMIKHSWTKRKTLLEHDFAVTGWALSILPEIREDVQLNLDGDKRMAIERVITKLHIAPNPNFKVSNEENDMIIDIFWKEFDQFQNKTGCFGQRPGRFLLPDALNGNSYLWHELYSLPYTRVLGFVACRVTSKRLGIGSAERSWADVKQIKDGKRSNLGGSSLEKRAILFTSAKLREASAIQNATNSDNTDFFGDDDMK